MEDLKLKSFELISCQATVYHPQSEASTPAILGEFYSKWKSVFDQEPNIMPTLTKIEVRQDDRLVDIPKIIFSSKSGDRSFIFLSRKIDFLWNKNKKDDVIKIDDFFKDAAEHFTDCCDKLSLKIGRLAAVVNRITFLGNATDLLAKHFCQNESFMQLFKRLESFELHSHKKYSFKSFNVNSWARNKAGMVEVEGRQSEAILLHQDINTYHEDADKKEFSTADIKVFYASIPEQFNIIQNLYYPGAINV